MKIGFVSLGCPKNLVDSEVMMGILARAGHDITARADDAEVLVVNTCSFIEPARKESVDAILEMAEHKKFGRAQKLIVAGCLVERYRQEIREQIPEVDAVIGTGEVDKILDACEGAAFTGENTNRNADAPTFLYHDLTPRILATPRHTAYIKINEGCDHPCAFCIIPQLRGRFRSRRFESVVREARNLAAAGVHEINLIGQDTTFYGEDLGIRDGLPLLLEELATIEDLSWIRFLYCYPNRITPKLLETIARHERLVKYLDIPLQHASRSVLARMKRGSHADAFLRMLERVRRTIPGVSLRTSFIVGFPGETAQDFRVLCDFVREAKFDWMGVFAYSDEETAKSFTCEGKIDTETIAQRRDELMAIQQKISRQKLRMKIGKAFVAMLEGPSSDTELVWQARLEGMAPEIDGKVYVTEICGVNDAAKLPPRGTMARVEINESRDYDLIGRAVQIVSPAAPASMPRGTESAAFAQPFAILT